MARRQFDQDELHWYALDVVRQKEYVAGYLLNQMGAMTFIPTETRFRKKTRHTKGKIEVAYAAFAGTVFAGFPTAPNWIKVRSIGLVNGVLSIPDDQGRLYPRRIDTASRDWIRYRGQQMDGQLTVERHRMLARVKGVGVIEVEKSVPLISVQGKGVIRSPAMLKNKASSDRPMIIRAAGERAKMLGAMLEGRNPQPHQEAA